MRNKLIFIISAALAAALVFVLLAAGRKNIAKNPAQTKTSGISASDLIAHAKEAQTRGDLLSAKNAYQTLLNDFSGSSEVANWQKKLGELNIKLLFSPVITPRSTLYEIKPGDTLAKIAAGFKTTVDLIMKSNNLADAKILPGRKIKVWTVPFTVVVDKSQNVLILKADEEVIKTYLVSTGKDNSSPVGTFKIVNKLANPAWFKAGVVVPANSPENILGTRWLGFDIAGYGIHGTTQPESLGKQVTEGCIRMSNTDVEELYLIIPVGTEVTILD